MTVTPPPTDPGCNHSHATCLTGLAGFSVKSVARSIGGSPATLYQRFGNLQGLLNACMSRAFELVGPPEGNPDRYGTLCQFSDEWWDLCRRFPGFSTVITAYEGPLERFLDPAFASYLEKLTDLGWSTGQARFAMSQIESAAARVHHFLSQAVPLDEEALDEEAFQMRLATSFIVKGLEVGRPEWLL